jgi:hypothetical protein
VAMPLRIAALVAFLLLLLGLRLWFIRREERIGRYAPPPDVDRLWLERNLLGMKPEVVGTAWDDTTGEAEVAALIARMAMEGKIENLPGKEPRLKLLVPRESLEGYEWEFVDAMFIAGDEITPKQLKKQYAATGFDPVTPLRAPLQKAAGQIVGNAKFGSGCAAVVIGSLLIAALAPGTFARIAGVVAFLISAGLASVYRTQLGGKTAASFLTFPLALFGMLVVVNAGSAIALAAALLATLVLAGLVFFVGAWTATREELDMLLRLRAAREWLRSLLNLLGTNQPEIEERWVPYILAFGLGQQLDQWSVAAPAPPASTSHPRRSTSTSIDDSSPSGPTFKAGGGAFGGAGATGGWAQSVASFAAAVPKPGPPPGSGSSSSRSSWSSSSSSRSSSSSSSSRSGGGGGGGW